MNLDQPTVNRVFPVAWLLGFVAGALISLGCATTSLHVTRQCNDGRLVQVVKPVVTNAPLNRLVLENRTREACGD
jgi:hypothetical protein